MTRSWCEQAGENIDSWGEQTYPDIALATIEEIGEGCARVKT
ncbi:hypothetical protein [Halorubrum tropicale]|nr:hypothetical protein [Halorubrum tropicale]